MRIFFTGGSGKAGHHVAPYLAAAGHQVTNADLTPLGHPDVTDLRVDLTDAGETYSAMAGVPTMADFDDPDLDLTRGSAYDAVVHFAAIPRILARPRQHDVRDQCPRALQRPRGGHPSRDPQDRLRLLGDDVRRLLRPG